MKLVLKNTDSFVNENFQLICKEKPCLDSSWHYHAQYELIYISKSTGIRFVGDSVAQFSQGDLVLVGPYLPHLWRNDPPSQEEGENKEIKTVIVKFTKSFIGNETFTNPRFHTINRLLEKSKYGISFGRKTSRMIHYDFMKIMDLPQAGQLIKLLDILYRLSLAQDQKRLSTTDMRHFSGEPSQRLDAVLKYIADNYAGHITLKDVANVACMTTNSFCRFFKKMTNKSFTQFLNEVRVRNASRLLLQKDLTVSEVCYMVGYNSITNFYTHFKQIVGRTPKSYQMAI